MPTVTDLESYQQYAQQQQADNNAWSAEQAQRQMDFQREMSNTAHQREVADLQAAGLNPILSVNSGASVPNGAAGDTDTSAAGNVGAILQQVLQAQSAREVAGMYNAATIAAASIAANASMYGADMSYQNAEDHPSSASAVGARIINSLVGGSSGSNLTKGVSSIVKAAFRPGQIGASVKSIWKSMSSQPKFYSWLARNGGIPKRLGFGSQQWQVALSMFNKGRYSDLHKFLQQFR